RPRSTSNRKIALDVERIKAMRKAGFSWRQIADYLDVGVSTVRRRLRETDAPRYRTMIPTRNETANLPDLPWLPRLNPYKYRTSTPAAISERARAGERPHTSLATRLCSLLPAPKP